MVSPARLSSDVLARIRFCVRRWNRIRQSSYWPVIHPQWASAHFAEFLRDALAAANGLFLAADRRLLVMLALANVRREHRFFTLLLETAQGTFKSSPLRRMPAHCKLPENKPKIYTVALPQRSISFAFPLLFGS
jgi:hypothetical protein